MARNWGVVACGGAAGGKVRPEWMPLVVPMTGGIATRERWPMGPIGTEIVGFRGGDQGEKV